MPTSCKKLKDTTVRLRQGLGSAMRFQLLDTDIDGYRCLNDSVWHPVRPQLNIRQPLLKQALHSTSVADHILPGSTMQLQRLTQHIIN